MLARQRQPQRPHSGGDDDARAAKATATPAQRWRRRCSRGKGWSASPAESRSSVKIVTPSGARPPCHPERSAAARSRGAAQIAAFECGGGPNGATSNVGAATWRARLRWSLDCALRRYARDDRGARYARDDGFVSSACGQFQRRSGSPQERRSILWRRERHSGPTEDNIRPTEFHANHIEPRSPRTPLSPRAERRSAQSRGSHHGCPWR